MCLVPLRTLLKPRSGRRERRSNSSCSAISRSSQSITVASVSAAHPPCRRVGRGTALLASSWNRSVYRTAPHHARPDYPVLQGTPEYPISHHARPASGALGSLISQCSLAQRTRVCCGALARVTNSSAVMRGSDPLRIPQRCRGDAVGGGRWRLGQFRARQQRGRALGSASCTASPGSMRHGESRIDVAGCDAIYGRVPERCGRLRVRVPARSGSSATVASLSESSVSMSASFTSALKPSSCEQRTAPSARSVLRSHGEGKPSRILPGFPTRGERAPGHEIVTRWATQGRTGTGRTRSECEARRYLQMTSCTCSWYFCTAQSSRAAVVSPLRIADTPSAMLSRI